MLLTFIFCNFIKNVRRIELELDLNKKYQLKKMYADDAKIEVNIFKGELIVDLLEIFRE